MSVRKVRSREFNKTASALPLTTGIGLRTPHENEVAAGARNVAWVEVHSENYLGGGGPKIETLKEIRSQVPVSCHGVGLSLGSAEGIDSDHLDRLSDLFSWLEPTVVSEHVSWSIADNIFLNDLLPLPYTPESLSIICENIEISQERFGRSILIENPSTYLSFPESEIPEWEFMTEVARKTGCGLLLDINNIYVSAQNTGIEAETYLGAIPGNLIKEIHLAGHSFAEVGDNMLVINDHGSTVAEPVWALYRQALDIFGAVPTLIEWDTDVPSLSVLLAEALKADAIQAS